MPIITTEFVARCDALTDEWVWSGQTIDDVFDQVEDYALAELDQGLEPGTFTVHVHRDGHWCDGEADPASAECVCGAAHLDDGLSMLLDEGPRVEVALLDLRLAGPPDDPRGVAEWTREGTR